MIPDVLPALGFIPGGHEQIVVTEYKLRKGNNRGVERRAVWRAGITIDKVQRWQPGIFPRVC